MKGDCSSGRSLGVEWSDNSAEFLVAWTEVRSCGRAMVPTRPSDAAEVIVDRQERVLIITWRDGHRSVYLFDDLRRDCPCASCDDVRSKRLNASNLQVLSGPVLQPGEIQVTNYRPVGWYALSFTWNDGHDSGIYTYDSLRAKCPCEQCADSGKIR